MTEKEPIECIAREDSSNIITTVNIKALKMPIKTLEQDILSKIRDEIEREEKWLMSAGYNAYNIDIAFRAIKSVLKESEVD